MAEQKTDTELLALFREPASREKAFTEIVKKYQQRLYWHVRRMLVDHEDSNDVLQNVFIRVWNALARLQGRCPALYLALSHSH